MVSRPVRAANENAARAPWAVPRQSLAAATSNLKGVVGQFDGLLQGSVSVGAGMSAHAVSPAVNSDAPRQIVVHAKGSGILTAFPRGVRP